MHYELYKKPKNPIIIQGFPGFGLVGTIATEFLIDHLETELIGMIKSSKLPAMIAIHEGKVVQPLGIFYNKKYNIIILHVITNAKGIEWEVASTIIEMAKELEAKEIISLEGVGTSLPSEMSVQEAAPASDGTFYFTNMLENQEKLHKSGIKPLNEGIILGTTGTLILDANSFPVTCLFAETPSKLPDSKAAAEIIKALDRYIGLEVDYKPLLKQAEKFESKIKNIISKGQHMEEEREKKEMSYVG